MAARLPARGHLIPPGLARGWTEAALERGLAGFGAPCARFWVPIQVAWVGGPNSRWAAKEPLDLGPPLAVPLGSCQHQLCFLGHVPWCLRQGEVSGSSDDGLGLACLAVRGGELPLTLAQVWPGQVFLEVPGERDVFGEDGFRRVLRSLVLDPQGKGFSLDPCELAVSLTAVTPSPSVEEGGNQGPGRAHSELLLGALSPTTFVPSLAATVMPSRVSPYGMVRLGGPGDLREKLGLWGQVAPVVWKGLKMASTPQDCLKDCKWNRN